jgi:hypothetical protein
LIENETPECQVEQQFRREAAQADGALMGARKNGPAIVRWRMRNHASMRQVQVIASNARKSEPSFSAACWKHCKPSSNPTRVYWFEKCHPLRSRSSACRNSQPVTELGLASDPGAVFSQHIVDFRAFRRHGAAAGRQQRGQGYFNKSSFCAPPVIGDGTDFGNSGTGVLLRPGQLNCDLSILKTTPLRKGKPCNSGPSSSTPLTTRNSTTPMILADFSNTAPDRSSGHFCQHHYDAG